MSSCPATRSLLLSLLLSQAPDPPPGHRTRRRGPFGGCLPCGCGCRYSAVLQASGWCSWASCCAAKEAGAADTAPAVPSSDQIAAKHPPGSDQAAQPQRRNEAAAGEQNGGPHTSQVRRPRQHVLLLVMKDATAANPSLLRRKAREHLLIPVSQAPDGQAASDRPLEQVMEGSPAAARGRPPLAAIQSFKLCPDGTLTQQQTDAKVKVSRHLALREHEPLTQSTTRLHACIHACLSGTERPEAGRTGREGRGIGTVTGLSAPQLQAEEEVASGDELELALRLFGLTNFEILEERTLQTKAGHTSLPRTCCPQLRLVSYS